MSDKLISVTDAMNALREVPSAQPNVHDVSDDADYISRETMKDAIDSTTWYHQNRNKDMVEGASDEETAWFKAKDVFKAIENVPSAQAEPSQVARDIATIIENEKDMRVIASAQPDIKQAAKLLSDFIESCPGGDSYLITPDGEELRTDWGYAADGIQLIHDWAERRTDG